MHRKKNLAYEQKKHAADDESTPPCPNPTRVSRVDVHRRRLEEQDVVVQGQQIATEQVTTNQAKCHHAVDAACKRGEKNVKTKTEGEGLKGASKYSPMYMDELSFLTWSSMYVVPRVKMGEPPHPINTCANMKMKT